MPRARPDNRGQRELASIKRPHSKGKLRRMGRVSIPAVNIPEEKIPPELYRSLTAFLDGRSLLIAVDDGGTRSSLHYCKLPISKKVNASELLDFLTLHALRVKGVDE